MGVVPDLAVAVLILGITYALSSEGCFGAAIAALNILFSILVAVNFYEPLATLLIKNADFMGSWADLLCLGLLFLVTFACLKFGTEAIAPNQLRLPQLPSMIGRLVFAGLGAVLTVSFLLLLLYTAPITRKIGGMQYDHQPPFKMGIDRKLLAFLQYTSGVTFPSYDKSRPDDPAYGQANIFDPNGAWLVDHQNARPYPTDGTGKIPEPSLGGPTAEEAAASAGGPRMGG